jgi:hypothetical protein
MLHCYHVIYMISTIGIEDSQGNRIVDQRQVLKIWETYVTELYDLPYATGNARS